MNRTEAWPDIPFAEWRESAAALHLFLQIVGKYRLARSPWVNHSWHATFYVTSRGLTTGQVPDDRNSVEVEFDFLSGRLRVSTSGGKESVFELGRMTVAEFHGQFISALASVGANASFHGRPNELPEAIPFAEDTRERPYDGAAVRRFHRALLSVSDVLQSFRTGFLGKVSPVHLFWGSFDLAVTRFSGRTAPVHPGGIPNLPDAVTREAYSHEVSSAGFWAGGGPIEEPAFYSYAYPQPDGFAEAMIKPGAAYFDAAFGEFILPYAAVIGSAEPAAVLLDFLQSTYDAAATLGKWDRQALECPMGLPGKPRDVLGG